MEKVLNITIIKPPKIEAIIEENKKDVSIDLSNKIIIGGTKDHSKLNNLDYESSGHTGFASSKDLQALEEKTIPRRLDTLKPATSVDRTKARLFVDNNGNDASMTLKEAIGNRIVNSVEEATTGDYIMVEIGE